MTAFKELLIGGYVLRFWPSDNGWMCGITPQMMDALEANEFNPDWDTQAVLTEEIQRMAKRIEELEAKDEPYALEASMFSNDRVKIDPVTGNVGIGTPQQEAKDAPVQVSPLQFVEMVMEKEHLVGKPIFWAEWPNKEQNT
jgi:hypothetical protein